MRSALVVATTMTLVATSATAHAATDRAAIVTSNNQFAIDLYRAAGASGGNVVAAPGSVAPLLAMALGGAGGKTAAEIAQVLHLSSNDASVHTQWGALLHDLQHNPALKLATRGWLASAFDIAPAFASLLQRDYGTSFAALDVDQPAASAQTINQWIADKTGGRITNLVPASAITPLTRLLLANAITFKAKWVHPFKASKTSVLPFHLRADAVKSATTMFQESQLAYVEDAHARIVELPYAEGNLALVLIVPKQLDGWKTIDPILSAQAFARWKAAATPRTVALYLPKWKSDSSLDLVGLLKTLGMPSAFDERTANFSAMTKSKQALFIGAALHQAFIAVDEQGTEAAAATAMTFEARSMHESPPDTVEVRVDRPFFYCLRDQRSGAILFLGRVTNPS